jgi:hypothetical protein
LQKITCIEHKYNLNDARKSCQQSHSGSIKHMAVTQLPWDLQYAAKRLKRARSRLRGKALSGSTFKLPKNQICSLGIFGPPDAVPRNAVAAAISVGPQKGGGASCPGAALGHDLEHAATGSTSAMPLIAAPSVQQNTSKSPKVNASGTVLAWQLCLDV